MNNLWQLVESNHHISFYNCLLKKKSGWNTFFPDSAHVSLGCFLWAANVDAPNLIIHLIALNFIPYSDITTFL